MEDTRLIAYGIRYIVENYLEQRWTQADVDSAAQFYRHAARAGARAGGSSALAASVGLTPRPARHSTHCAGFTDYPFPRDLFEKFVRENDGTCCSPAGRRSPLTRRRPGYFPVRLEALPEGTVVHANCPIYQARCACHPPPALAPHSARR